MTATITFMLKKVHTRRGNENPILNSGSGCAWIDGRSHRVCPRENWDKLWKSRFELLLLRGHYVKHWSQAECYQSEKRNGFWNHFSGTKNFPVQNHSNGRIDWWVDEYSEKTKHLKEKLSQDSIFTSFVTESQKVWLTSTIQAKKLIFVERLLLSFLFCRSLSLIPKKYYICDMNPAWMQLTTLHSWPWFFLSILQFLLVLCFSDNHDKVRWRIML